MDNERSRRQIAIELFLKDLRLKKKQQRLREQKAEESRNAIHSRSPRFKGPSLTTDVQGEKKSAAYLFKLTPREKKHLKHRALTAGMMIGEYIRTTMRIGMEYV